MNEEWKDIEWSKYRSRQGALGHEQRHVKGAVKLVDRKIISLLKKETVPSKTKNRCGVEATLLENKYQNILNNVLHKDRNKHKDADANKADDDYSDQPNSGELYPPL